MTTHETPTIRYVDDDDPLLRREWLAPGDAATVRESLPMTLMQLSVLLHIDPGRVLEEMVHALRDERGCSPGEAVGLRL